MFLLRLNITRAKIYLQNRCLLLVTIKHVKGFRPHVLVFLIILFFVSMPARMQVFRSYGLTHYRYVPYNYIILAIMLTFCFVSTSFQPIYVLLLGRYRHPLSKRLQSYFRSVAFYTTFMKTTIYFLIYFCHLPNRSIIKMTDLMVSMNKVLLNAKLAFSLKSHLQWSEFQTIIVRKSNN